MKIIKQCEKENKRPLSQIHGGDCFMYKGELHIKVARVDDRNGSKMFGEPRKYCHTVILVNGTKCSLPVNRLVEPVNAVICIQED